MQRLLHISIGLIFACIIFSCNSEEAIRPKDLLQYDFCKIDEEQEVGVWNYKGHETKDAFSGSYVSRISTENLQGIEYVNTFSAKVNRHNIRLIFHGRIRSNDVKNCGEFLFQVKQKDSVLFEKHCDNKRFVRKTNEWNFFCDTVILTQNLTSNALNKLCIAFQHNGGASAVDVDDLHLKFFDIHNFSFLPKTPPAIEYSESNKTLIENNFYKINYNEEAQILQLSDKKNQELTKQITYILEYKTNREDTLLTQHFQKFSIENITKNEVTFFAKNELLTVHLNFKTDSSSTLKFSTKRDFHHNIFVGREAIVIEAKDKLSEVYRSNRQIDNTNLQDEYWLDKEGAKFGNGDRSMYFYHNQNISSAQLNTVQNQLIVNLDFNRDHTFLKFPLIENPKGEVKIDLSEIERKAKTNTSNTFELTIGIDANSLPRFMRNSEGFISTYIFTEHADNTDLRTHLAVNYGSEDISSYSKAISGFAKYNLPVTKSIFYNNPSGTTNLKANKNFSSKICNLKETNGFEKLIDELYANGHEICLHTPENLSTTIDNLNEALTYFTKKYKSNSWIDHGYANRKENNREDFVCDGLTPTSSYYALELWKKNKLKYFWNCYNEHSWIHTQYHFSSSLTDVYHGWGDRLPMPNYWLEPNAKNMVYSWTTNQHFTIRNVHEWKELYNEKNINDLIFNQGNCFNHCYTASVDGNSVCWFFNDKGKIEISPEFNDVLKLLAYYRDKKLLNVTTIEKFLDYNIAVDAAKYEILGKGKIKITNLSTTDIKGLNMIAKAQSVSIKGKNISTKKWNGELVFWFDLKAGESVVLEY